MLNTAMLVMTPSKKPLSTQSQTSLLWLKRISYIYWKTVTKKTNPAIHWLTIMNYIVWLKFVSRDYEFSSPGCHRDLQPFHIKDQLICSLHNEQLQTKANQLTSLKEAYKSVQHDQSTLYKSGEASIWCIKLIVFIPAMETTTSNTTTQTGQK